MIQVQIASQITPLGVEGIRWVLVDPTDSCGDSGQPPADVLAEAVAPVEPSAERSLLSMGALKLGVTGLGLGLALWTAQAWLGAPTAPGLAPTADPQRATGLPPVLAVPTPTPTPTPTQPTAQPAATPPPDSAAPAAPAAPADRAASAAAPLVTAEL